MHVFALSTEPQFNKDQPVFTHINSSHARLNLQGWVNGGCPISAVTLEFRPKGQSIVFISSLTGLTGNNQSVRSLMPGTGTWSWQNVRTNVSADVFLAELREATWYELKMKACNSAGCGNQSSQFATLDYDGSELFHLSHEERR